MTAEQALVNLILLDCIWGQTPERKEEEEQLRDFMEWEASNDD